MKKKLLFLIFFLPIFSMYAQKKWDFASSLDGWSGFNSLTSTVNSSILTLTITGGDPYFHSPDNLGLTAAINKTINIRMKNNTAATDGRIYFTTTTATGMNEAMSVGFTVVANDPGYTSYTIDMSTNAGWTGTIKQIRLDPVGSASSGTILIDYVEIVKMNCTFQTITFNSIGNKKKTDPPFTISATATSGMAVTFSIISGPATLNGTTLTLSGTTGTVVVSANQSGNTSYCPADEVRQTFFVTDPTTNGNSPQNQAFGDQWVGTDALGRILPSYTDCGAYRANKYIGLFYWLWHASIAPGGTIKPVPQLLKENPNSPAFECKNYYWGEPENGYYHDSDPWVIRRNLQLLADAGVDFIFFDFTNGNQGCNSLATFMGIALDMYNKGIPVPRIAFFLNENYDAAMNCMLDNIYNKPNYDPLIFKWNGKPLIMADSIKCKTQCARCNDRGVLDYFTWRRTWAFDPNQWNFLDQYPQDYYSFNGKAEQMPICKAMGAPMGTGVGQGSSYHAGKAPTYDQYWESDQSKYGYFFEEQWTRGHSIDPSILCVTGWNELMAGAWPSHQDKDNITFMNKSWNDPSWRCVNPNSCLSKNTDGTHKFPHGWFFVDEYNTEFNRDIEPMKGGYTDDYYYQLVSHIRKFKGMKSPETISSPKTITVEGTFTEWSTVTPVFYDASGDVINRNFQNVNNSATLTNNTARNDIIESRVTYDANNTYFYVKTVSNISAFTGNNWMLLFLDVDRNKGTGWEGYDYVINNGVTSATQTTLKQWTGTTWSNIQNINYAVNGNQMEISIPRTSIKKEVGNVEFYFHWADNPQQLNDITSFFTDGESAPDRRFDYNYGSSHIIINTQSPFTSLTIPGTVEMEDFDNGGVGIAYADADIANNGGKYRPSESVDISDKTGGGYYVGWMNTNEWLEYTVNVTAIGYFTATIYYASTSSSDEVVLYVDDIDRSGSIIFPSTGDIQTWATKDVTIQLTQGKHLIKVFIKKAAGDLNIDKIVYSEKSVVYPGNGQGLWRSYWTATVGGRAWFQDSICGVIDTIVNENWGDISPGCDISKDYWNGRWEGQIDPLYSEVYTFYITVDDNVRLWINDTLVIDKWTGSGNGLTFTGTIALTAGKKVPIRLDYAEKTGNALVKLEWSSPSNTREIIPQSQLYPILKYQSVIDKPEYQITIFPNPAKDFLIISMNEDKWNYKIVDLQGRELIRTKQINSRITKENIASLDNGVYCIKITTSKWSAVKRIIINK